MHMERYVDISFPPDYIADLRHGPIIVTSAHIGISE
jgi:hypothetical protein